ncbi:MAG: DUF615 domain-containing protein [gamma proteobacterium symbiont of Bathyaustriella thionipta]|nr:DUF615 domain-containing protein [gamma proteobacterium symbiont of Bathyaustriella thionipta]MCU7948649.1 DUF615 domain-containing protein [gamma proteobacterium symbiont of Bathyaustriella thionipta]MCU7953713.1 DUF615 domain-containing protein [gamma proteobacterium symbiont of Bathyaustriella thionipta]MCU7955180.1 DUF615 domain-containing protein [gamma proteobacterium symbiont of Bathyaustriella thionipta]MCU7968704.1 DUF615 domain-containing protein [gamma proteobacterium symbiont of 
MAEADEHYISKSQAKRDVEALQKLGLKLVELSKNTLEKFDLDEKLLDAILLAQTIRSHSGHRRQVQLIGKLMRHTDADAIRLQLERYQHPIEEANAYFHKLEKWRDRLLIEGDSAIHELLTEYPEFERSRLRQLLRNAKKDSEQNKAPKSARQLFKYLKEVIIEDEL